MQKKFSATPNLLSAGRISLILAINIALAYFSYFCTHPARASLQTDLQDEDGNKIRYVGNRQTLKFHRLTCPYRLIMREKLEKNFACRSAATNENFRPCRYCLPPFWKKVKGKVLL